MTVIIHRIGARGDGVAIMEGRSLHVPYALPGETVTLDAGGKPAAVIPSSPERVAPFCPHYGICGGCKLQHWASEPYAAWKRETVVQALRHAGLETDVAPLIAAHGKGRRAIFHATFEKGVARLGFMTARTHDLIDLDACPVLVPALANAPEIARRAIRPLSGLGKPLDVQVTATLGGLDIDIRGVGKGFEPLRLKLADLAASLDLARLSVHGETIVERRAPALAVGKAMVTPPPGGFLQATDSGEETLAALVVAALGKKIRKVADLFSGCGPFALRIAATHAVDAFDSDRAGIQALDRAARAAPGLRPIQAEARDLFRRPLLPHEIKGYDALVLDPPRAGAEAQVKEIARAGAPARIIYVSCDRETFARDAALLVAAGWRLERVTPVDQFAYTAHVELVGVFSR